MNEKTHPRSAKHVRAAILHLFLDGYRRREALLHTLTHTHVVFSLLCSEYLCGTRDSWVLPDTKKDPSWNGYLVTWSQRSHRVHWVVFSWGDGFEPQPWLTEGIEVTMEHGQFSDEVLQGVMVTPFQKYSTWWWGSSDTFAWNGHTIALHWPVFRALGATKHQILDMESIPGNLRTRLGSLSIVFPLVVFFLSLFLRRWWPLPKIPQWSCVGFVNVLWGCTEENWREMGIHCSLR